MRYKTEAGRNLMLEAYLSRLDVHNIEHLALYLLKEAANEHTKLDSQLVAKAWIEAVLIEIIRTGAPIGTLKKGT